jgi:ribosomal protein S18 acetylase RimI-like enzyme
VTEYRTFRNADPPQLAAVWGDAFPGRGAYPNITAATLERWLFPKPYFDPAGLLVADAGGVVVGFSHAGFGPDETQTRTNPDPGVVSVVAVRGSHRRRGIGSELLRRAEAFLTERGARALVAGPVRPLNPFYFGLYGGSDAPGFLASDPAAGPFFEAHGYRGWQTTLVFQRRLGGPVGVPDARFTALRRRMDVQVLPRVTLHSWWTECVFGPIEPVEFRVADKLTGRVAGRVLVWELEGYSQRWGAPAAGVIDLQVREDCRRQGVAKFLMAQVMKYLHDLEIRIVEVQAPDANQPLIGLLRGLGFAQVDVGRSYRREAGGEVPRGSPG